MGADLTVTLDAATGKIRFESTDFASVMIDDVGCSRRHQCPQCDCSCRPDLTLDAATGKIKT